MARSESARACPWSAARKPRSTSIGGGRFVFIVTAGDSTGGRYQLDGIRTPAFQAPLRRNSRLTLARLMPTISATNTAPMVDRWITTVVSVLVSIHPRPAPCTDGHPDRVRTGHERSRTPVNGGQHCWKACWQGEPRHSAADNAGTGTGPRSRARRPSRASQTTPRVTMVHLPAMRSWELASA